MQTLTPEQKSAIEHIRGPLPVIAGPGAGKTRVIVEKCVYLIKETRIKPENILVTTFTNKARDELYYRLYGSLENEAQKITVSTIHSFCQKVLTDFPAQNPLGAHFEVLDGEEQFLLVYDNLKNLGLSKFPKTRVADFIHSVIGTFNLCTEESVDPDRFIEETKKNGKDLLGFKKAASDEAVEEYIAVAEAYKSYKKLLSDERLVDFPTLQEITYKMIEGNKEVVKRLSEKYKYFLRLFRFGFLAHRFARTFEPRRYVDALREDVAHYCGPQAEIILFAPHLFDMLSRLLDDGRVTKEVRQKICLAIAYFITPFDVLPEEIYGVEGYFDQCYVALYVLKELQTLLPDFILTEAWEGEGTFPEILSLLPGIEKNIMPENIKKIHRYLGL